MIRVIAYWGLYWGRDTCTIHLTLTIIISTANIFQYITSICGNLSSMLFGDTIDPNIE